MWCCSSKTVLLASDLRISLLIRPLSHNLDWREYQQNSPNAVWTGNQKNSQSASNLWLSMPGKYETMPKCRMPFNTLMNYFFTGNVFKSPSPFRNKNSKWYASYEEWPYDIWARKACSGSGYFISGDAVPILKNLIGTVSHQTGHVESLPTMQLFTRIFGLWSCMLSLTKCTWELRKTS